MKKVYIASPYSVGDPETNVRRQIDAADELINAGFYPYLPLLSHYQHIIHPHDYETWVRLDNAWVSSCDALLRLPGESKGADDEVMLAFKWGLPIYHSVEDLVKYYPLYPNSKYWFPVETTVEPES
jgi:hypothetical protein